VVGTAQAILVDEIYIRYGRLGHGGTVRVGGGSGEMYDRTLREGKHRDYAPFPWRSLSDAALRRSGKTQWRRGTFRLYSGKAFYSGKKSLPLK